MRHLVVFLVLACAGLGVFVVARSSSAQSSTLPTAENDLNGRIAVIFLDSEMRVPSVVLADIEFARVGDRDFILGNGADTRRAADWRSGMKVRVAWEKVTGYMPLSQSEFDNYVHAALQAEAESKREHR